MASEAVVYRFETATEFRMQKELPEVRDVVHRGGQTWVVADISVDRGGGMSVLLKPQEALAERGT